MVIILELNIPKITFKVPLGQPTLNTKKTKLKLVKTVKRNQGKQAFLGILDFYLGIQ